MLHQFASFFVKTNLTANTQLLYSPVFSCSNAFVLLGFEGHRVLKGQTTEQRIQLYYISILLPLSAVTYCISWTTGKCNIERLTKRTPQNAV